MQGGDDSAAARGARLKRIRLMAGLSTGELAHKTGFSRASISYWENAAYNGLSHKGAEKITKVLNEEYGIKCDVGWLLLGIGDMPVWTSSQAILPPSGKAVAIDVNIDSADKRRKEIELFTKMHKDAVVLEVKHNFMRPLYEAGDWLGGCWTSANTDLIGKSCIVHEHDLLEVRILREGDRVNKYNLSFLSYSDGFLKPFELRDVALTEVAPVVRVWK